jgi:hypothetical protein
MDEVRPWQDTGVQALGPDPFTTAPLGGCHNHAVMKVHTVFGPDFHRTPNDVGVGEPPTFLHLRGRQSLAPASASFFGKVGKRAFLRCQVPKALE